MYLIWPINTLYVILVTFNTFNKILGAQVKIVTITTNYMIKL